MTFSSKQRGQAATVTTTIHGEPVEQVKEYKYLGTISDNLLKLSSNTEEILRKRQSQQNLLRKLCSFRVSGDILLVF